MFSFISPVKKKSQLFTTIRIKENQLIRAFTGGTTGVGVFSKLYQPKFVKVTKKKKKTAQFRRRYETYLKWMGRPQLKNNYARKTLYRWKNKAVLFSPKQLDIWHKTPSFGEYAGLLQRHNFYPNIFFDATILGPKEEVLKKVKIKHATFK